MKCPRCGRENESGSGFCISCGTKLVKPEAAVPERRKDVRICPQCGKENEGEAGFCMNCGAKLVKAETAETVVPEPKEDILKCPQCGQEIQEGIKFCANCGARLEKTEAAAPVREDPFTPGPNLGAAELQPPKAPVTDFRYTEPPKPPVTDVGYTEPPKPPKPPVTDAGYKEPSWQPETPARNTRPYLQLPTCRGLAKMFFLGIITLGIYSTVIWSRIVTELNITASRYDGKRTMPLTAMWLLAPITLGIYPFVWYHQFCNRVGNELKRRGLNYKFSAATFWLWNVLGMLIVVGPWVFVFKLMKAMNKINGDFNVNG